MGVVEVEPAGGRWQVLINGRAGRRFRLREHALSEAERLAERRQAELRVKDSDGSIARETAKYEVSPGFRRS
jgi:hypothetical protein